MIATPDREVRPQIEAIKAHLLAEGLADIEELLTKTFEGFHTIHATFNNQARLLRLSYQWLSDCTAQKAVAWLQEKEIARSLRGDDYEITILEGYVRDTFGLDAMGLRRAAVFLLAHVLLDTRLIARALFTRVSQEGAGSGIPLTTVQALADKIARDTFGAHLSEVRAELPGDMGDIAFELNEARNALVHWRRDRFSLPIYKGQDVTTEAGFRTCMDDVLRFIQVVPFNTPRTTGGGHIA